jgi:hypothetical protein
MISGRVHIRYVFGGSQGQNPAMAQEPRRLSSFQRPEAEPERGQHLAALIRQEWHEGMTHAELVAVTTNWDAVRLLGAFAPAYAAELEQEWRDALPILTLPGILAALGLADPPDRDQSP